MLRSNLLFIHIIAAMGIFLALGIEGLALAQLRRASDGAAVRAALGSFGAIRRITGPSLLLLLLTGLYLTRAFGDAKGAWIGLGILGLVAIAAVGGLVTGRNMRRLHRAMETDGEMAVIGNAPRIFRTSYALRLTLLLLVVYLMTVKPG